MEIGFYVIGSVLIGILIGFIANKLPKNNKLGLFTSFAIGMIGALTGSFILNLCRVNFDSLTSAVLVGYSISVIISAIFLYMAFRLNKQEQNQKQHD